MYKEPVSLLNLSTETLMSTGGLFKKFLKDPEQISVTFLGQK